SASSLSRLASQTTRSSSTARRSGRWRPSPRGIHLPVSKSNRRSTSKAFLSAFLHGGRLYLSLTSPPAPRLALPIGLIQYRAAVTYLPFIVRRRCSTG